MTATAPGRRGGGAGAGLTREERAAGTTIGADPDGERCPRGARSRRSPGAPSLPPDPRAALRAAVRRALLRPPCGVSFSGGRDSSAMLALALAVAREDGLPAPVALTLRFPEIAGAQETGWQELVAAHLGLADWERVPIGAELDFLGEIATGALRRDGLLWPANAHAHAPLLARVPGGCLITGLDGDGLFGWRFARVRADLTRPGVLGPRALARAALAVAPAGVRSARHRRAHRPDLPWLTVAGQRRVGALLADDAAREPVRWDRRVEWFAGRRHLSVGLWSVGRFGHPHDTRVVHPLQDRAFLAALARAGGRGGLGPRDRAMRRLFDDLLPAAILQRRSKAEFGRAFWGERARRFAVSWDGTGLDEELIDPGRLRAVWTAGENPPLAAATLLQDAWLSAAAPAPTTA